MNGYTVSDCGFCRADLQRKVRGIYRAGWLTTPGSVEAPATVETNLYWCGQHNRAAWDWLLDQGLAYRLTRLEMFAMPFGGPDAVWQRIEFAHDDARASSGSPFPGAVTAGAADSPAVTPAEGGR